MYTVTSYTVLNGGTSDLIPIKGGFFKTIKQIGEYETLIEKLEQYNHQEPVKVLLHYKVPIKLHKDWNKQQIKKTQS